MITVDIRRQRNKKDMGHGPFSEQKWEDFFSIAEGRTIYLFGAGRGCREFLEEHRLYCKYESVLDNDESRVGLHIDGIPIQSPSILEKQDPESYVVLITSIEYDDEIRTQLEKKGAKHIFSAYALVVKENRKLIRRVYQILFEYQYGLLCQQGIIHNYLWFHLSGLFRMLRLPIAYKQYKGLKKYKGIHENERCFIVATGPSLRVSDIEMLKEHNEITFSVNSITKIFDKTEWRPDYYVIYDPLFIHDFDWRDSDFDFHCCFRDKAFLSWAYIKYARDLEDVEFFPVSFLNHWRNKPGRHLVFSDNPIWGYYCAYTVINTCIQFAQYMGFAEIYLLGVDCDFNASQKHFHSSRGDDGKTDRAKELHDNMVRGYRFIGDHVSKRGTRVYNATRGGKLEVFPRVTLEDILNPIS